MFRFSSKRNGGRFRPREVFQSARRIGIAATLRTVFAFLGSLEHRGVSFERASLAPNERALRESPGCFAPTFGLIHRPAREAIRRPALRRDGRAG